MQWNIAIYSNASFFEQNIANESINTQDTNYSEISPSDTDLIIVIVNQGTPLHTYCAVLFTRNCYHQISTKS